LPRGLSHLRGGNLIAAGAAFDEARSANPDNEFVKLLSCTSNAALNVLQNATAHDLLLSLGGTPSGSTSNVCEIDFDFPEGVLSDAPSSGVLIAAANSIVLPQVEAVLACLRALSPGVRITFDYRDLPPCLRPTDEDGEEKQDDTDYMVNLDRGEALASIAALEGAAFTIHALQAYDLSLDLYRLLEVSFKDAINAAPQLLTLRSASNLFAAKDHLGRALEALVDAIDAIRNRKDTNHQHQVLVIDDDDAEQAAELRLLANQLRESLLKELDLPIDVVTGQVALMDIGLIDSEPLNLSILFSGELPSLRSLLPPFCCDAIDADDEASCSCFDTKHFPDPTFSGITPGLTQHKIDNFLSGGPACATCERDEDCNAFGFGDFYCDPCFGVFCNDPQPRCRTDFDEPCGNSSSQSGNTR